MSNRSNELRTADTWGRKKFLVSAVFSRKISVEFLKVFQAFSIYAMIDIKWIALV